MFPKTFPKQTALENLQTRRKRKDAVSSVFLNGRTWDRTRDLSRVKRALSR
jgi:hypothetical protein